MDPLIKIEEKLDRLHDKIDLYQSRLVKVEVRLDNQAGWIKWGLTMLLGMASMIFVPFFKMSK